MSWSPIASHREEITMFYRLTLSLVAMASLTACESIRPYAAAPAPVVTVATPAPAAAPKTMQAASETSPASMITPMLERKETMVATGYAVISIQNHKNPAQQRLLAIRASKLDAYRALTEQVYGQQLDATTTVADMTVLNDTFRTRVEGVIYGATLVSITPVGDDTYETTLSLDRNAVQDLRILYLTQVASRNNR
jgi:outer membrane protein FlgP